MDILVSSNFERLLWFLAFQAQDHGPAIGSKDAAGTRVRTWLDDLKTKNGFQVEPEILEAARAEFETERVSDEETLRSIAATYQKAVPRPVISNAERDKASAVNEKGYILDPHSAIGTEAALRSMKRAPGIPHVSLATAHPAKFSSSVEKALEKEPDFIFDHILPEEFRGLEDRERRLLRLDKKEGLEGLKRVIRDKVPASQ